MRQTELARRPFMLLVHVPGWADRTTILALHVPRMSDVKSRLDQAANQMFGKLDVYGNWPRLHILAIAGRFDHFRRITPIDHERRHVVVEKPLTLIVADDHNAVGLYVSD